MLDKVVLLTQDELEMMIAEVVDRTLKEQQAAQPAVSHPEVMDIDAFCAYTGLSKQTVYRKTRKGEVPHSKRGKRLYFDKREVDEWLLANKVSRKTINEQAEAYFKKRRVKR